MGEFIQGVQFRFKRSSAGIFVFFFRVLTGLFLGLTFALIGQELIGYGSLAFWFVIVTLAGAFLRISRSWNAGAVVVFNLVCILVGMLLRMYIVVAPN